MRNKDFIKNIVLTEYRNIKLELTEAVGSWLEVKELMAQNNIRSLNTGGQSAYKIRDNSLGDVWIVDDGTAILAKTDTETTWSLNDSNIVVDGVTLELKSPYTIKKTTLPSSDTGSMSAIDTLQTVLDWLGFIPGFGDILDAVNAIIYFARGMYLDGILSLVAIIPVVGSGIKLSLKGAFAALGSAATISKIWKKAANGSPDDLIKFYREALASGKISKIQLEAIAKKGDMIADLLTSSKRTIQQKEAALAALGVNSKAILKQIDDIAQTIQNTTSIPVKKSFLSKVGDAVKASKAASTTIRGGKFAFNGIANMATFGGFGIAKNLIRKLGIGKREMGYLKNAMDLRFIKKVGQSPTVTTAMFKANDPIPAEIAKQLGIPSKLSARSTKDIQTWFSNLQATDPKKWKQVSEYIGASAVSNQNLYYLKFVENSFQQASNIFRPGTVFKAGAPEMFAKALKLDSYRLSNPKNLDIVKNEIEDLAEKLGLDEQDDPNGVIMPALFMAFGDFLKSSNDTIQNISNVGAVTSILGGSAAIDATNSIPGSEVVDTSNSLGVEQIKSDFKEAPGTTLDKLDALAEKGYDEAQIFALKKILDIE
jgi:hypothetical protein